MSGRGGADNNAASVNATVVIVVIGSGSAAVVHASLGRHDYRCCTSLRSVEWGMVTLLWLLLTASAAATAASASSSSSPKAVVVGTVAIVDNDAGADD